MKKKMQQHVVIYNYRCGQHVAGAATVIVSGKTKRQIRKIALDDIPTGCKTSRFKILGVADATDKRLFRIIRNK